MWINSKVLDYFHIAKDAVEDLRNDVARVVAERDSLTRELASCKANLAWMMERVNVLESERAQLVKIAYNITPPVPQYSYEPRKPSIPDLNALEGFEHISEDTARRLGVEHLLA